MDALDTIIRGVHDRLGSLDERVRRLERLQWIAVGAVGFGTAVLKLAGCIATH